MQWALCSLKLITCWKNWFFYKQGYHLVVVSRVTILVPCPAVKSPQLIWRSATCRWNLWWPGPCLRIKTVFPGMGIPMLKIRRSWDRLIFNIGIPILVRRHFILRWLPDLQMSCGDLTSVMALLVMAARVTCPIEFVGFTAKNATLSMLCLYMYVYIMSIYAVTWILWSLLHTTYY